MDILIVTRSFLDPDMRSGQATAVESLARELHRRGHAVTVAGRTRTGTRRRATSPAGYAVDLCPGGSDLAAAAAQNPSGVLIFSAGGLVPDPAKLSRLARLVLVYHNTAEYRSDNGIAYPHAGVVQVANSPFTARRIRAAFGIEAPVILPAFDAGDYRAAARAARDEQAVLFVNPIVEKGVMQVLRLAEARPAIRFAIREAWSGEHHAVRHVRAQARALANVHWWAATPAMAEVFAGARILLAPSLWEEAFGRIVAEAQANGVPVLASDRGALPETVGAGGILLDVHAPLDAWLGALDRLWGDDVAWTALSRAAAAHAARPEIDIRHAADQWLALIDESLAGRG
jgi:glycosyltransferase involved in cell wall biosynthesis